MDYKNALKDFIQVFSECEKLNTDMCIIKYDDAAMRISPCSVIFWLN